MTRCESCGHENQPIFRFCLKCGAELKSAAAPVAAPKKKEPEWPAECPHCAAKAVKGRHWCVVCGREVVAPKGDREEIGKLVQIRPDGTDGDSYPLWKGPTGLGSGAGDHVFTDDAMMSNHHADIVVEKGELRLYDRDSEHGTFIRIDEGVPLEDGGHIRIGQQLLTVDLTPSGDLWGELSRVVNGEAIETYPLEGENVFLGRERGHVVFPEDGYVSGSHAVIFRQSDGVSLKDLGSSNGTYLRISEPMQLESGRLVLIGAHLFRLEF